MGKRSTKAAKSTKATTTTTEATEATTTEAPKQPETIEQLDAIAATMVEAKGYGKAQRFEAFAGVGTKRKCIDVAKLQAMARHYESCAGGLDLAKPSVARSLLAYLASPAAADAKRKQGMEPA